jgi:PilZ domain
MEACAMSEATVIADPAAPRSFEDMRGAQRFTLLIRTAKLICESAEFLCIIRDVSETGVRLRLFHDLPAEGRMALELSNGEVYFIERVWERDSHAGFQFAAPIDVHTFIAEVSPYPRRQPRLRLQFPAVLSAEGQASVATVRDLSPQGARIETTRFLAIGQRVKLEGDGFPAVLAKVCWRSGSDYGLVFEQVYTLETLAVLAAALQNMGGSTPPEQHRTAAVN